MRADASALPMDLAGARAMVTQNLGQLSQYASQLLSTLGLGAGVYSFMSDAMQAIALAQAKMSAEKRMDATWNATRGAIGKTQEELKEMVKQWERVTNFDGTDITNALASMLTYTALNAKELEKVMETAMDITAVFGGDLRQNAEQVARLLSNPLDPHTGLGSLSRKGYYITPEQRKQMKEFQKAGDEEGARGVMMQILSGQEGAARRIAGPMTALKELQLRINDTQIALGDKLIPIQKKWQESLLQLKEIKLKLLNVFVPFVDALVSMNLAMAGVPFKFMAAAAGVIALRQGLIGLSIAARIAGLTMRSALVSTGIGAILVVIGYAINFIIEKLEGSKDAMAAMGETWSSVVAAATEVWANLIAVVSLLKPYIGIAVNWAVAKLTYMLQVAALLTTNFKLTWELIKTYAEIAWLQIIRAAEYAFQAIGGAAVGSAFALWAIFQVQINNIIAGFELLGRGIIAIFKGVWIGIASGGDVKPFEAFRIAFQEEMAKLTMSFQNPATEGAKAFAAGFQGYMQDVKLPYQNELDALGQRAKGITGQMQRELEAKRAARAAEEKKGGKGEEQKAKDAAAAAPRLEGGRFGFQELGSRLQDLLLKDDKNKIAAKHLEVAQAGNVIQDKILAAVGKIPGAGLGE